MSNENPFLKGPRVQGDNPFLNGPRISRPSPLGVLGSQAYQARAQNLTRSRSADELIARGAQTPAQRTMGEAINDTALALRTGASNVTAGVIGLPIDLANLAIDNPGAKLGRLAATRIGDALGLPAQQGPKTIKGMLTGSDYFEQPEVVRGIREGIAESNKEDFAEWASPWLQQRERQFDKVGGFGGTLGYLAQHPGYAGHVLAGQVPQLAMGVVPGSKLGTLLAQGASAGGQASAEVSDALRKKGLSEQEIAGASAGAFAGSAAINTVTGPLLGRYGGMAFERAIGRELAEGASASVAGRLGAFGKAVAGEVASNIIEEGGDQINQNFWSLDPILDGVGKASAIGGLMGAGMGAAAGASIAATPAKPSDTLRNELLTLGEELAGRDVARDAVRNMPEMPQPVSQDVDIAPEDTRDIDALLLRNLSQGLGEQLAAGVNFAQQAPRLDVVRLGEQLAGDVLSQQPESNPEPPVAAGGLFSGEVKTEAPQGMQGEVGQSDEHPITMQNRDRSRAASVAQMQSIRSNPDPERLGFSRDPNAGAPMVGEGAQVAEADKGAADVVIMANGRRVPVRYAVVESEALAASHTADGHVNPDYDAAPLKALNNGRTAGLQAAWAAGHADAYREGIIADARLHGVSPEAIAGKRNPVLVRLYDPAENTGDMGAESNASAQLGLSPVEQAQTDARTLPDMTGIQFADDGSISPASNAAFFRAWFHNVGATQAATLQDAQGRPNALALQRLKSALVYQAYGDERLLTALAEDVNPERRNVLNALAQAAPAFAALEPNNAWGGETKAALTGALELLRQAGERGLSVQEMVAQGDMLGRNAAAESVALFMAENARSAKRMAEAFRAIAEHADNAQMAAATHNIFGNAPTPTIRDSLEYANDRLAQSQDENTRAARFDTRRIHGPDVRAETASGRGQSEQAGRGRSATEDAGAASASARLDGGQGQQVSGGLFGAPSVRDHVDAARRAKDAVRDGRTATGRTDMMAGDGELFAGPRPEQVDIEDAVKAQSEPKRSSRNGISSRDETGIPAGLPAVSTAASERLAGALHAHLRRLGYSGKPPRFLEILPSSLPHELYAGLQALGRVTGTRVVIFRNLTPEIDDFNGVNFRDGTVYINENNEYPATLTAAHEWVHNLKETHPELYQQLENEVRRQGRIGAWHERNIREEGMDRGRNHAIEELTAAAVSDALTDPAFLQRLAERNRGLFRRVARAFLDFLNTLTSGWRDQGSNAYLRDVEAFRDKLAEVLDALPAQDAASGSADVEALYSHKGSEADPDRQFKDTERAYGGRAAYDKAKADGRTKLTYGQWVQVRTPRFKQWFGDWEAVRGIELLASAQPLNLDDVQPLADKKAVESAFRSFDMPTNRHDGRKVRFPVSTAGKVVRHKGFDIASVAGAFDRLFESAVPMMSQVEQAREGHKDHTRNIEGYHHYVNRFTRDGKTYYVRFAVQQMLGSRKQTGESLLHSAFVSSVEIYEQNEGAAPKTVSVWESPVLTAGATPYDAILSQWLDAGKRGASKVTDPETGEPLVVYHGTAQNFDVFEYEKSGSGKFGKGFYFTEHKDIAQRYAYAATSSGQEKIVVEAFVRAANPFETKSTFTFRSQLGEHGQSIETSSDFLKKNGSDGVISRGKNGEINELVLFEPNQIKSATGNSGAFDAENPDIRFSRKAQTKAAYEARIDALFAGAKGNRQGVRILDRADMLDMLGHGDKPLHLVESAVGKKDSAGRVKHPGMTAEMWKRLPEWIENPVAAFESDTVDGRITLVAPDLVDGKPALVVLEPNGSMAGMDVHVAVNAYEKDNAAGVPTARWVRDGKLLYLDQKRSPTFSERSGLQLPRDVRQLRGYKHRVQTEADLHKYRAERDEAMFSRREENIRKAKDKADAKREEVRQSLAVSAKAAGWNYDTSKWEGRRGQLNRLRAEMQDKMLAWRDAQNQIEEKLGEVIPDAANVYRLENLMHGRVGEGLDRLERNAFEPLIKAMHAAKVDTAALEEYLYALHARERNADIAAKNPKMPDGGSGMTNAEAEAILAKADHAKMAPLAQMVRRIIRQTRQRMLVHGLITQETFDALNAQYEWYVPLRGKPEEEPWIQRNKSSAGRGLDGRGKQVQEALGRGAGNLATDLLANVFRDAQMSVINAEKARVGRGLMRLVLMNPNPGLWQVEPVQTERALNSEGEVVERVMYDFSDPSIITVRHNGNLYRVQVNSAPLAEAMTHAGVEHLDKVFRMAGSINRYFSAVLTKYNPSFTLVNASRDMIFGLTGLAVEHGEKAALQAAMRYPQAAKAAWRQARGQFDAENEWDVWAREFVEHGGKTGMIHVHDVEAISRDIGKGLLREASTAKQVGKAAVEAIGHANDAVENALRLSAYVTLRQQGMSADKAAEYAKNLTVNFNRKGYLGSKMNAWFLFYNASIQGSHRTIKLMKRPKTWGYLGALALAQAVSALAMMGMEDEDGRTLWEQIPEHVKQRNLVIPTGGDSFAAVPMPYGFNWFVYMSGQTVQAVNGNPEKSVSEKAGAMAEKAASALVQAFSPVPLNDGALGLLPTMLRIPANVQANRNDFGNAIRRENPYSKSDIPRASMGHADTAEIFKVAAKGLNRVGGGDDYRAPKFKTLFDWAPEDLEYLVKTATGGMGKFVIDIATVGGKAMEGDDVEVTVRDVPIINRFVSQVDERAAQASLFYERRAAMDEYLREARGILKAEGVTAARRFIATRPELSGVEIKEQKGGAVFKARADSLYAAYKAVEAGSKARNERVNMAFANSPNWPIPTEASRERNRQVREADQVLTDKRQEFNRRWEAAVNDWARGD